MRKLRALVTGGAGFIGSHLTELLLAKGYEVIVTDSFIGGRRSNLKNVQDHPLLSVVESDIRKKEKIAPLFEGVDHVFHLAGLADIVPSIEKPKEYFETNVNGTFNVLECSREAQVKKVLYAASSTCYGIPSVYPTPEDAPMSPQYPYALTKYMGEELVMHWHKLYNLPTISLRLFNVFGPRARTSGTYGAVFGVFLAQKLNNRPYTVVGDGCQTRDFTYVTDVADAFYTAANSSLSGEILNVGSSGHYSINYLVSLLKGDVVHVPKRPGEPDCTFANTSKIERLLGWKAQVSFEEGVNLLLSRIQDFKDAPVWDERSIKVATNDWFKYLSKEEGNACLTKG